MTNIEKRINEIHEQAKRMQRGRELMAYHRKLALEQVQVEKKSKNKD